jgi:hypothetical protein
MLRAVLKTLMERYMSKPVLGVVTGGALGLIDGLSAWFHPEARSMMIAIIIGSTVKGVLTGLVVGFVAKWKQSLPLGILAGAIVGFMLSALVAMGQPAQYWEIVLPGMLVGVITGVICQRWRVAAVALCCVMVTSGLVGASQAPPASRLSAVQPLVGKWEGTSEGQPGSGTLTREYRLVLGDRFIEETNRSVYPPQEKNPKGEVHEHRSFFSFDNARKTVVFRQFHVEGFVNQYVLEPATKPGVLVFVSEAIENIPKGYRARETYTFVSENAFEEVFEIAEPGKDFEVYSKARLKRVP